MVRPSCELSSLEILMPCDTCLDTLVSSMASDPAAGHHLARRHSASAKSSLARDARLALGLGRGFHHGLRVLGLLGEPQGAEPLHVLTHRNITLIELGP